MPDDGPDVSILSRWDFYILQMCAIENFQANTIITIWCSFQRRAHDASVNMLCYNHVDSLDERCLVTLREKTDPERTGDILVLLCFGGVAQVCSSESTEKE